MDLGCGNGYIAFFLASNGIMVDVVNNSDKALNSVLTIPRTLIIRETVPGPTPEKLSHTIQPSKYPA